MSAASAFSASVVTGSSRKLVAELLKEVGVDRFFETSNAAHCDSYPKVLLVAIQRRNHTPLPPEHLDQSSLTIEIELLCIQIQGSITSAPIIHEPYCQRERCEHQRSRDHLPPPAVELFVENGQLRKAECGKPIGDPLTISPPELWRCAAQIIQMTILPINVVLLCGRVVHFEERVSLAPHRSITKQTADDDGLLCFRETSHGIALARFERSGFTVISRCV